MPTKRTMKAGLVVLALVAVVPSLAQQQQPDPATLIAAQKEAMGAFKAMDGVWRGPSWILLPSGEKRESVQTERIGPFLDGSIKVIEGKGYGPDGKPRFNAFGIISYNPATKAYTMRSYAQGQVGDFKFEPTADGYTWEIPAGPVTIHYVATIKDGTLKEVGDRIQPGKDPVRFFEMTLKRIGDSDWPAAGAISPK